MDLRFAGDGFNTLRPRIKKLAPEVTSPLQIQSKQKRLERGRRVRAQAHSKGGSHVLCTQPSHWEMYSWPARPITSLGVSTSAELVQARADREDSLRTCRLRASGGAGQRSYKRLPHFRAVLKQRAKEVWLLRAISCHTVRGSAVVCALLYSDEIARSPLLVLLPFQPCPLCTLLCSPVCVSPQAADKEASKAAADAKVKADTRAKEERLARENRRRKSIAPLSLQSMSSGEGEREGVKPARPMLRAATAPKVGVLSGLDEEEDEKAAVSPSALAAARARRAKKRLGSDKKSVGVDLSRGRSRSRRRASSASPSPSSGAPKLVCGGQRSVSRSPSLEGGSGSETLRAPSPSLLPGFSMRGIPRFPPDGYQQQPPLGSTWTQVNADPVLHDLLFFLFHVMYLSTLEQDQDTRSWMQPGLHLDKHLPQHPMFDKKAYVYPFDTNTDRLHKSTISTAVAQSPKVPLLHREEYSNDLSDWHNVTLVCMGVNDVSPTGHSHVLCLLFTHTPAPEICQLFSVWPIPFARSTPGLPRHLHRQLQL